jgi:transposase
MKNQTRFRPYEPDQLFLLPPDMKDWLPRDDLVYFLTDVVGQLDLEPIYRRYNGAKGGQPPYDPRMMVGLLLYAYCQGLPSSRKIERATHERITFRVLTADQQPDHDTVAEFRKLHLDALAGLFVQVLQLCQKAGLVKLGHVALDGTKVKANASKHKSMSYGRMEQKAAELREEVERLLAQAERTDAEEDAAFGKGRRGDELPDELRNQQTRLAKIEQAMAELEAEAKARADALRKARREKDVARERAGKKRGGPKPKDPDDKPKPESQRNFTDPESRIMKDGATKSFEQSYNCQAAVDETANVIVGAAVTQDAAENHQLQPLL